MSLSKSKCWYSNNCLHFLKCAVPIIIGTKLIGWCIRQCQPLVSGIDDIDHFRALIKKLANQA